jgi:hypothetical protein
MARGHRPEHDSAAIQGDGLAAADDSITVGSGRGQGSFTEQQEPEAVTAGLDDTLSRRAGTGHHQRGIGAGGLGEVDCQARAAGGGKDRRAVGGPERVNRFETTAI